MKEQIKAPEIIQLSNEEIANLSDAQFKTLVIRMLTEMIKCGCKNGEKVKAMQSEITKIIKFLNGFMKKKKRKIYREPKGKGRNLGLKSTTWSRRKK